TGYQCRGGACLPPMGAGDACTGAGQGTCAAGLRCENAICCSTSGPSCCAAASDCGAGLACNTGLSSCYATCNNYDTSRCADSINTYCLANACVARQAQGHACSNDA